MGLFTVEALRSIEKEEQQIKKRTILIVDDEEQNLKTLKYALDEEYDILTASDGQEALQLLENDPNPGRIHVIISDQRMPKMTGVEFLAHSRAIVPRSIRIILTGYTDVSAIMDSINQAQIYRFIVKPFDKQDMLLTIERGLRLFDLEAQNLQLVDALKFLNGQFFNQMRGILQRISGSFELLERPGEADNLNKNQHTLLHQMAGSTDHLIQLLNKASELSFMYTGNHPVAKEQLDIVAYLKELGERFSAEHESDLTLHCQWDLGGSTGVVDNYYVDADRTLLSQALQELLDNAFQYADKPTTITIGASVEAAHLCIWIQDQGIGKDREEGERLVLPFVRGKQSASYQPLGLGIGLAKAKAYLEAQGGELLWLGEEVGSTVQARLPLPFADHTLPQFHEDTPQHVLIFQKNEEQRRLYKEVLEFDGHTVSESSTPEALESVLAESSVDVILLEADDDRQPTISIIQKIQATTGSQVPRIVVLAQETAVHDQQIYLDAGAEHCVSQPIDYKQLSQLIYE